MNELQAVGNWIILRPIAEPTKTAGGIIIPVKGQRVPDKGEVVSIGGNVTVVQVGQKVLYKKWEAVEIKWMGEKLLAFEPKHLLAVLN